MDERGSEAHARCRQEFENQKRIISRMAGEIERRESRENLLAEALDRTPTASAELLADYLRKEEVAHRLTKATQDRLDSALSRAANIQLLKDAAEKRVNDLHSRDGSCCRHCLTVYPCDTLKALEGDEDV